MSKLLVVMSKVIMVFLSGLYKQQECVLYVMPKQCQDVFQEGMGSCNPYAWKINAHVSRVA
jgi:hypothetical protein